MVSVVKVFCTWYVRVAQSLGQTVGSLEARLLDTVVSISDFYVRGPSHITYGNPAYALVRYYGLLSSKATATCSTFW